MSYAMKNPPRFPPPPTNLPRLTEAMYWAARGALSDRFPGWDDDDLDHLWDALNTVRRVQSNTRGVAPVEAPSERVLEDALRTLIRRYVALLENARNRILDLGGQCDPVDKMEAADPWLREARNALAHRVKASEHTGASS